MTAKDLQKYIGGRGSWLVKPSPTQAVGIEVKVIDARQMFGRLEFKITPVAGHSDAWVDSKAICDAHDATSQPVHASKQSDDTKRLLNECKRWIQGNAIPQRVGITVARTGERIIREIDAVMSQTKEKE